MVRPVLRAAKCFALGVLGARRERGRKIPESNTRKIAAHSLAPPSRSGSRNGPACSEFEFCLCAISTDGAARS